MKEHLPEPFLEKYVVDYLKRRAKADKITQEDFLFKTILNEVSRNYDVDGEKLEKMMNKLIGEGEISTKSKELKVYIPSGYEKKYWFFK